MQRMGKVKVVNLDCGEVLSFKFCIEGLYTIVEENSLIIFSLSAWCILVSELEGYGPFYLLH